MCVARYFPFGVLVLFMAMVFSANASEPIDLPAWCTCESDYIYTVNTLGINGEVTIKPALPLPYYPKGAWLEITFEPHEGYIFAYWSTSPIGPWTATADTETLIVQVTGNIEVVGFGVPDYAEIVVGLLRSKALLRA